MHQHHDSLLAYNYHSHKPLTTVFLMIGESWWRYLALVIIFCIKHFPQVLIPVALGYVIDLLDEGKWAFAQPWFLCAVAILLVQNIPMHILFVSISSRALRRLEQRLRASLAHRLQQLSIAFHDNTQSGRLQAKILRDVELVYGMCQTLLNSFLNAAFSLVFAMVTTLAKAPVVALFFLAAVPLAVWFTYIFIRPLKKRQHDFRTGIEAMSARVSEMVQMIPMARAHAVEEKEIDSVTSHLHTVFKRGRKLDITTAFFHGFLWVTLVAVNLAATAFTSYLCWKDPVKVTPGDVVMYSVFYQMLLGAVQTILGIIPVIAQGAESIHSIGEVLECPDIEMNEGKLPVDSVDGRLAFDHVSFAYAGAAQPAIRDFSLDISPGECVAFVGESGAGKSTLMNLAIGFVRPTEGRLLLDREDMEGLDLRDYRDFIAVVPQQTVLMSGSIRANVLYGREDADEDNLMQALEAANALEFIEKMPEGLETIIGERGARISGGQQQRISIARALIRDPKIIILDEATSSLDVISEALVQEAVDRLVSNRTTLIVAHRLSTVRKATRIVVMKDGRCVEMGTPTELLEAKGEFHKLHSLQQMLM